MMIRLLLVMTLLCGVAPTGMALPCQQPDRTPVVVAVRWQEDVVSPPVSTSTGAKAWVRLVGQAEEDGRIVLRWQTNPTQPARTFRVERSTDGVTWNPLGEVSSTSTTPKNAYQFTDDSPLRMGVYRLQCLTDEGSQLCSSVLSVVNPRRPNQPVRYFTTDGGAIVVGIESGHLIFPVTANLYSEAGLLLCYDQLPKNTDELRIDVPVLKAVSVKLQIVDGAHRVLAVRTLTMPR